MKRKGTKINDKRQYIELTSCISYEKITERSNKRKRKKCGESLLKRINYYFHCAVFIFYFIIASEG